MYRPSQDILGENPELAKKVDACVKNLVEAFDPEKILLFGSFARGELDDGGTLDFMIIANSKLKFFERIKKALDACSGSEPAIEPIVYTEKEFEHLLYQGEGFLEDALEEGKVLYQRNP